MKNDKSGLMMPAVLWKISALLWMLPALLCMVLLAGIPGPAAAQVADAPAYKQLAFDNDIFDAAIGLPENMRPFDDELWPVPAGISGPRQMSSDIVFELEIEIADPDDNQVTLGLGLHPEATEGYDDGRDVYSPPPFPGTFFGGIFREENGMPEYYARLYLPAGTPTAVWPIHLQAGGAGYPIGISWDPSTLPGYIEIQLQDSDGNTLVSMLEESEFVVEQGGPLQMQIYYTSDLEFEYVLPSDSLALVDFYFETGEAGHLTGWLQGPVATWYGVTVEDNRVTRLELPRTSAGFLSGSLPESIGDLDALQVLNLNNNLIEGALPETIGNLTSLQELILAFNNFSGTLPASLLQLSEIRGLYLIQNAFEGEWYTADFWSAFPKIQQLHMGGGNLTGSILPEIAGMSELRVLRLVSPQMTGTLPAELAQLTELEWLVIHAPDIVGTWPTGTQALQNLGNLNLRLNLDQSLSEILEELPKENLEALVMIGPFVDEIPEMIGSFDGLQSLALSGEALSGSIPDAVTTLESLVGLQIFQSPNLGGTLPSDWSRMTNLELLNISNTNVSGSLPESFGDLGAIQVLILNNNQIEGALPETIGNLTELVTLSLLNNPGLGGPIPESYLNLENLRNFHYNGTGIRTPVTDAFRAWLSAIPSLFPGDKADLAEAAITNPGQGETVMSNQVVFEWEELEYAESYQLELYWDAGLTDTLHIEYQIEETRLNLELPDLRADYYWQVRGVAGLPRQVGPDFLLFGPWSETHHFEVNQEYISGPELLAPEHEAVDEPLPVTLSWKEMESAGTYHIEVSLVPSFDTTLTVKAFRGTEFMVPDAMDGITYFWRVRGQVGGVMTAWSETRSFTTELRIPEVPDWTPFDGQDDVETDVILAWNPSLRAESYDVQLSDDPEFETRVAEGTNLENTEFEVSGLQYATSYYWKVRARNASGHSEWSEISRFTTVRETSAGAEDVPLEFALNPNYPNPFNPATVIGFQLPVEADVTIEVYDMLGRRVEVLVNETTPAGNYEIIFDASRLTSGVYVYRMRAGSFSQTRSMTLVK